MTCEDRKMLIETTAYQSVARFDFQDIRSIH